MAACESGHISFYVLIVRKRDRPRICVSFIQTKTGITNIMVNNVNICFCAISDRIDNGFVELFTVFIT